MIRHIPIPMTSIYTIVFPSDIGSSQVLAQVMRTRAGSISQSSIPVDFFCRVLVWNRKRTKIIPRNGNKMDAVYISPGVTYETDNPFAVVAMMALNLRCTSRKEWE